MDRQDVERTMLFRIRNSVEKLRWGIRAVGLPATVRGLSRAATISLRRPRESSVRLASGSVLEFEYPGQFPTALVTFGDLIDPEYAFLRQVHRPGWQIADVGAAIGQFTVFSATLPSQTVHSFEPSGRNVAMLRRNIALNGLSDRVVVHQLAFSDADGEAVFCTTASTWISHLGKEVGSADEMVPVRRLAGEFNRLGIARVSVLKVNVAGHEPNVLRGAEPFLAAGRAEMLILLIGLRSLPWYQRLASFGYRFFYYHPVQRSLHEVKAFDERSIIGSRPWPARHIIGIHVSAMAECLSSGIRLAGHSR